MVKFAFGLIFTLLPVFTMTMLPGPFTAAADPERKLNPVIVSEDNAPSLSDYVSEPTFFGAELSPNGDFLAAIRRDGVDYYLVIADLRGDDLQFVGTRFEDLRVQNIYWATDTRLIVEAFARFSPSTNSLLPKDKWFDPDVRSYNVSAIYGIDRDGSNLFRFFEGDADMDNIFTQLTLVDTVRSEPDHMLVQRRALEWRNKKTDNPELGSADLYRVNIHSGEMELIERGDRRTIMYQTDSRGTLKYRVDTNSIETRQIYHIAETQPDGKIQWREGSSIKVNDVIEELEQPFKFNIIAPSDTAPYFYVRDVPGSSDRHAIYLYDLSEGKHIEKIAEHPEFDMGGGAANDPAEGAILDPNTNELIGVSWSSERYESLLFAPDAQQHLDALKTYFGDQMNVFLADMSVDGKTWLVFATGPGHSGIYATYDLDAVKVREVAVRNSALAGKAVYETKVIRYQSRDGTELFGYLTLPPSGGRGQVTPFVMYPHGGPQARDYFTWDPIAQLLASNGYTVFQPQFRGSAGKGKKFAQTGYREWGGIMQTDVEDAYTALSAAGYIDPERACIMGFSYGGYAAMQGAVAKPDAYRCVIAGGGVYDLRAIQKWSKAVRGSNSSTYEYWTTQLGDPVTDFEDLVKRSPARNLDKLKAPVFLFHGANDEIVPVRQAELLRESLLAARHPHEYVVMPKAGHEFGAYRTSEPFEIRKDILEFLARYNPTERNAMN